MANLSPWFDHIQAARKALDLADTWLASKEMEIVSKPFQAQDEEEVMIGDKELDTMKAESLTRDQLLVKLDEYRQRLEDPLKVGQALAHIFYTPERLVDIPRDTSNSALAQLRNKLFGGLPQVFRVQWIDPLSWNILASFLKHNDSKRANGPRQTEEFLDTSPRFEVLAHYIKAMGDGMPFVGTWEAASTQAFRGVRMNDGYLPLFEPQTEVKAAPLPVSLVPPPSPEAMLDSLRDSEHRNKWQPAQAVWYIKLVLEHPDESERAFKVASARRASLNFEWDLAKDPMAYEQFKRWACHCAILVRSNGIWLSPWSTFSRKLNPKTLDRLFTALFLL